MKDILYPICLFLDPRIKQLGEDKMSEWRLWFDNRLDNAIEAAAIEDKIENNESTLTNFSFFILNSG